MSIENVELVQRLYEAWARQEFPGPTGFLDPDVEYVNPDGAIEPGVRRGVPAFAAAVQKLFEGWETWEMEPEQFFDADDRVAVVIRYRAKARRSGVEVDGRESALLTIRDGKISRYEWFHAPGDALKVLGLDEQVAELSWEARTRSSFADIAYSPSPTALRASPLFE